MNTEKRALVSVNDEGLAMVSGVLDFDSVPSVAGELSGIVREKSDVHVDLSEVTDANSAALSLLIEIQRVAFRADCNLSIDRVPEHLIELSQAYGLGDDFLEAASR